jgi:hypothetical protein
MQLWKKGVRARRKPAQRRTKQANMYGQIGRFGLEAHVIHRRAR